MNVDDTPCTRRCVRAGTEDDPQLLPATHGRYCSRCWGRINQALIQAPELTQHILANVTSSGSASDERVDASKAAPLPFNEAAFVDANELYSMLVYWCGIWADYLEVRTPASAARAWRRESGTVTGLPSGLTPEQGSYQIGRMTGWLRDRLDEILTLAPEDVDEFDNAIRDVWRMNARWPRIEKPRYSEMPCPRDDCGQKMAVYPPTFKGDAQRIVCEGGHWYPPEEYDHLVLVFAQQREDEAREKRAKGRKAQAAARRTSAAIAHLMGKYVNPVSTVSSTGDES